MNRRIGIDHEHVFVESWVDSNDVLDLVVHLQFQGVHRGAEMNLIHGSVRKTFDFDSSPLHLVQEVHEGHLRVTLATITRLGAFAGLSDFGDHDIPDTFHVSQGERVTNKENTNGTT